MRAFNNINNWMKRQNEKTDHHNYQIIVDSYNEHKAYFTPFQQKAMASIIEEGKLPKNFSITAFYLSLTLASFNHLNHLTQSTFELEEFIPIVGRMNGRSMLRLMKNIVRHTVDWNKISFRKDTIMGDGVTKGDPIGTKHMIRLVLLTDIDMDNGKFRGIPIYAYIWFSRHYNGMIKIPMQYSRMFNIKKGNRYVYMLDISNDTHAISHDEYKRYDREANPYYEETGEQIEYDWS